MKYDKLDALITSAIESGKGTFCQIDSGLVYDEAKNQSEATGRLAFRIIDGRLQALRKKGAIKFDKKWLINK